MTPSEDHVSADAKTVTIQVRRVPSDRPRPLIIVGAGEGDFGPLREALARKCGSQVIIAHAEAGLPLPDEAVLLVAQPDPATMVLHLPELVAVLPALERPKPTFLPAPRAILGRSAPRPPLRVPSRRGR